jgi:hypothetical protein
MSSELRLKKLRGSGGYVMATVNDQQQMKGNLGGPDLFLAPIGRLDSQKITIHVKKNLRVLQKSNMKIQMKKLQKI